MNVNGKLVPRRRRPEWVPVRIPGRLVWIVEGDFKPRQVQPRGALNLADDGFEVVRGDGGQRVEPARPRGAELGDVVVVQ